MPFRFPAAPTWYQGLYLLTFRHALALIDDEQAIFCQQYFCGKHVLFIRTYFLRQQQFYMNFTWVEAIFFIESVLWACS